MARESVQLLDGFSIRSRDITARTMVTHMITVKMTMVTCLAGEGPAEPFPVIFLLSFATVPSAPLLYKLSPSRPFLNVEVSYLVGVRLDKLPSGLDFITH